jgi:hypothetical protein
MDDYRYRSKPIQEIKDVSLGFGAESDIGLGSTSAGDAVDYGETPFRIKEPPPPNDGTQVSGVITEAGVRSLIEDYLRGLGVEAECDEGSITVRLTGISASE